MNKGVIIAYIKKEFKELAREKMIYMVYIIPIMILVLFGYGIRLDITHCRTIIIDNDNSIYSKNLINRLEHSKYFSTKTVHISEDEALRLIKQAKTDIIIIIPSSFEKRLLHRQKTEIGVFIDASFPTRSTTMESYVKGVILNAASSINGMKGSKLITINNRNLFNQAMRDEDAIVPGLIGLVLLVAPAILAALTIVKEKERGTIFNFYSSPITKEEFLIAKLTPPFILHSLNIFILFLFAEYLFKVPFRGSFTLYWAASELYVLISLSIGLLVSVITRSQIVALVLTVIITILPGFLYSGIILPISSMGKEAYIEAHLFPVMYYNHIVYDTFLIGQGLASKKIQLYLFILVVYAFVLFALGRIFLKKELK